MHLLLVFTTLVSASSAQNYYNASFHETTAATDMKEVDSTVIPTPAYCIPEPTVVSLTMGKDLSETYQPSCTRVNRCGGCCPSDQFNSCQPTEIQKLKMRVFVVSHVKHFAGPKLNPPRRKKIIEVEKHLKCRCDCIVKEKDCNSLQRYIKQQCKCMCTNEDEKEKCLLSDPQLKFWDSNICSCQCRNVQNCTTNYFFNIYSCSCEKEQIHPPGQHSSEYSGHK